MHRHRWLLALLLASVAACDPCFGTAACEGSAFRAQGYLLWWLDVEPARSVRVQFTPTSGIGVDSTDAVVAYTNAQGAFQFEIHAPEQEYIEGSLSFHPPAPYDTLPWGVTGIRVRPTQVRGDADYIGWWGVGPIPGDPHITYTGRLSYAATGEAAAGVEVEFRRTGGIATRPDPLVVRSDERGVFAIELTPAGEGDVVGDLMIRPPAPYRSFTVAGVRMSTLRGKNDYRPLGSWEIES